MASISFSFSLIVEDMGDKRLRFQFEPSWVVSREIIDSFQN